MTAIRHQNTNRPNAELAKMPQDYSPMGISLQLSALYLRYSVERREVPDRERTPRVEQTHTHRSGTGCFASGEAGACAAGP